MGEVWEALQTQHHEEVALKILSATAARRVGMKEAFRREVRAVAGLEHLGIVSVLDFGEVGRESAEASDGALVEGSPWLAMELARGGTLLPWCGNLAWEEIRSVLLQVLQALGHAHARGVVHRDLKPDNVLFRKSGSTQSEICLTDFGLAHAHGAEPDEELEGGWLGTPSFMAPEQFTRNSRAVGPWTDLYGVGCLAWALATGSAPYAALKEPEAIRAAQRRGRLPPLQSGTDLPAGFSTWVRRLLEREPGKRYRWAVDASRGLMTIRPRRPAPGKTPR